MLMDLTLGNLQHLDGGKAAVTFADQVKTVAKDCYDRAGGLQTIIDALNGADEFLPNDEFEALIRAVQRHIRGLRQ